MHRGCLTNFKKNVFELTPLQMWWKQRRSCSISMNGKISQFQKLSFSLSHPSKPLLFSSLSSNSETNTFLSTNQNNTFFSNITNRALYLLRCCRTSLHLFQIQSHLVTSGLFRDSSFAGRILKLSSNLIDDLCYTLLIFKHIRFPDAFCVNTVIKKYTCSNYHAESVVFYVEMLRGGGFYPNGFTFPPLISACAKLGCLSLGQMCYGHAVKFGVDSVLPVKNSLIHFYACCGLIDVARSVFDEMLVKDLVTWNTMIDGYAKIGQMGSAHCYFNRMPQRSVISWNVMITGYLNCRNPGNALKLFREMMSERFGSDDTTMVQVITACGRSHRLKEGRSVHGFLVKSCLSLSLIVDTAMIDAYSKSGRADVAQLIFERMPRKNLVSWNAMILGHCIHGNPAEGLSLYAEMKNYLAAAEDMEKVDSILPDEVTFIGVLCGCARLGLLEKGKNHFSEMSDIFCIKPSFAHYWCMAILMANVGLVQEAVSILKNIPSDEERHQDYSVWAGLFGLCRFEGNVALGEQIANNLIEEDPHNVSHYNLLLNIYAAAGKWEQVNQVMQRMGMQRAPPCYTLKDLTHIVTNIHVGVKSQ